jgi:hypothetical protein
MGTVFGFAALAGLFRGLQRGLQPLAASVRAPSYSRERMFENLSDRLAGTLLMGLDVAVEFATLGEFRLVDPDLVLAPTPLPTYGAPLVRRPAPGAPFDVDFDLLPRPATALARAARPEPVALSAVAPSPVACAIRRRRGTEPAKKVKHPVSRTRGGAVQPPEQLCLLPG